MILTAAMSLSLMAGCGNTKESSSEEVSSTETSEESSVESSAESSAEESESSADEDDDTVHLTVKLDSTDGTMEFYLPDGWSDLKDELSEEVDSGYTVVAGALDEAVFFMAASESKSGNSISDQETYHDELVKIITSNESLTDVSEQTKSEINLSASGFDAYETRFTATYEEQSVTYWVITTEDDNCFYQMCGWTTTSNALKEGDKILAVADGFYVIG